MIVILILAVLVGIVIATYLAVAGNASSKAADYNLANGSKMMSKLWYDLSLNNAYNYSGITASTMSNRNSGGQTSTRWAMLRASGSKLFVRNVYKNGRVYAAGATARPADAAAAAANLKLVEGTIGVLDTYYIRANGTFKNFTTEVPPYEYHTIVTVSKDGLARWETYRLGAFAYGGTSSTFFAFP